MFPAGTVYRNFIRAFPGAVECKGKALECAVPPAPRSIPPGLTFFSSWSPVPSGPPRKVEVEPLNSTAVRVSWKLPVPSKQHGQIRGYQVTYVRLENGETRGPPIIQDVMLAEAQVCRWQVVGWAGGLDQHAALPLPSPGSPPSPPARRRLRHRDVLLCVRLGAAQPGR